MLLTWYILHEIVSYEDNNDILYQTFYAKKAAKCYKIFYTRTVYVANLLVLVISINPRTQIMVFVIVMLLLSFSGKCYRQG